MSDGFRRFLFLHDGDFRIKDLLQGARIEHSDFGLNHAEFRVLDEIPDVIIQSLPLRPAEKILTAQFDDQSNVVHPKLKVTMAVIARSDHIEEFRLVEAKRQKLSVGVINLNQGLRFSLEPAGTQLHKDRQQGNH